MKYIGSTTESFRERFSTHVRLLRLNKHSNAKLQNSWNKHKEEDFEFIILEVANNKEEVILREQYYIDLFDSDELYNICPKAGNTLGIKQPESTILNKSKEWIFVDPKNKIYNVINMREFCREYGLPQSHMINIANKKKPKHHKGWISYKKDDFSLEKLKRDRKDMNWEKYKLISPNGEIFIISNLRKFCEDHDLDDSCIINMANNNRKVKQHKGWKAYKNY